MNEGTAGLVTPSGRTGAGYRVYSAADVERLHQVLTYRELGFPLEQIATLLDDPSVDAMAHLEEQRTLLSERIDRLHRMVAAVEEMMNRKQNGIALSAEDQAEIFGDDWLGEGYAEEAQERWGDTDAWKQSAERTAKFTKDDWQRLKAEGDALEAALADGLAQGFAPGTPEANALAERHRAGDRPVVRLRSRDAGEPGTDVPGRSAVHQALRGRRAGPGPVRARHRRRERGSAVDPVRPR